MIFIQGVEDIPSGLSYPCLTIGNFDGAHLGHQALFNKTVTLAHKHSGTSIAITFHPHPTRVLRPEIPLKLISTLDQKVKFISYYGIDILICIPFTKEFASTSPTQFVKDILIKKIGIKELVVGYDYSFGRNREGNINFLKTQGVINNFKVHVVPPVIVKSLIVSSTLVRELIAEGKVEQAAQMLGRPFEIQGVVQQGMKRGGPLLGFPTANIYLKEDQLGPKTGVYAVIVQVGEQNYKGVMNVGYNPTFEGEQLSAEVHILEFNQDIYGKTIDIKLIKRLREEKTFSGPQELAAQIKKDISNALAALEHIII